MKSTNSIKSLIVNSIILLKFSWILFIRKPIIIFVWHQVSSQFSPTLNNFNDWTSSEDFEKSIKFLKRYKFHFISLSDAYKVLSQQIKRTKRYIVITFDDGYATINETISILEKYNIPATFFINTAYLNGNSLKWTDVENFIEASNDDQQSSERIKNTIKELRTSKTTEEYDHYRQIIEKKSLDLRNLNQIYLTHEELFSISNPLFSIGLHGHEHEHHDRMKPEWNNQNILKNLELLHDHPNFIPFFAFPFGSYRLEEAEDIESKGYKTLGSDGLFNIENKTPLNRYVIDGKVLSFKMLAKLSGVSCSFKKSIRFLNY